MKFLLNIITLIVALGLMLYFKAFSKEYKASAVNYQQPWHVRPTLYQRLKLTFLDQTEGPLNFIRWCWNPTRTPSGPKSVTPPAWFDPNGFIDPKHLVEWVNSPSEYAAAQVVWMRERGDHEVEEMKRLTSNPKWFSNPDDRRTYFQRIKRSVIRRMITERDRKGVLKAIRSFEKWEGLSTYWGVPLASPPAPAVVFEGFLKWLNSWSKAPTQDLVANWQSQGLDVNSTCALGRTPLHYAMNTNKVEVVRDLLNAGADALATDVYGDTPLHALAKFSGEKQSFDVNEMVELLLAHGADPEQPNNEGLTPHDLGDFLALEWLDRRDRLQEVVAQTRPATVEAAPRRAM